MSVSNPCLEQLTIGRFVSKNRMPLPLLIYDRRDFSIKCTGSDCLKFSTVTAFNYNEKTLIIIPSRLLFQTRYRLISRGLNVFLGQPDSLDFRERGPHDPNCLSNQPHSFGHWSTLAIHVLQGSLTTDSTFHAIEKRTYELRGVHYQQSQIRVGVLLDILNLSALWCLVFFFPLQLLRSITQLTIQICSLNYVTIISTFDGCRHCFTEHSTTTKVLDLIPKQAVQRFD